MQYSKQEQETTITWDEQERIAHIYSSSPITIRKLDKLVAQFPDTYSCVWSEPGDTAKKYTVSHKLIKFSKPVKPMSDEQREAAKIRGKLLAEKRLLALSSKD